MQFYIDEIKIESHAYELLLKIQEGFPEGNCKNVQIANHEKMECGLLIPGLNILHLHLYVFKKCKIKFKFT